MRSKPLAGMKLLGLDVGDPDVSDARFRELVSDLGQVLPHCTIVSLRLSKELIRVARTRYETLEFLVSREITRRAKSTEVNRG